MEILSLVVNASVIAAVGLLLVRGERRTAAAIEGIRGEVGEMRSELREVGRRIDAQSARIDVMSSRIDAHVDRHAG